MKFKENVLLITNSTVPNHFLAKKMENHENESFQHFHGAIHCKNKIKKNSATFRLALSHKKRKAVFFLRRYTFFQVLNDEKCGLHAAVRYD